VSERVTTTSRQSLHCHHFLASNDRVVEWIVVKQGECGSSVGNVSE
jgi:hypothetical protein